jgi:hypothetical protein
MRSIVAIATPHGYTVIYVKIIVGYEKIICQRQNDLEFIKTMIHYEIDLALFGVEEARRNLIRHDPQATFAISQFGEAQRLTELARNAPRTVEKERR